MKFEPRDFIRLCGENSEGAFRVFKTPEELRKVIAEEANARLQEMLKEAPVVLRMEIPVWIEQKSHDLETVIMSARLVDIREIEE